MHTVLIICDEASAADVLSLRAYLELSDLRTVVCDDGRQALSTISRDMVDIVVIVSRGGAVDGFMTIRRLREKSDVPVVVLAEHSDESDRIMAFELGCDDIISSPFSFKEIVLRLKARLKRRDAGTHDSRQGGGMRVLMTPDRCTGTETDSWSSMHHRTRSSSTASR